MASKLASVPASGLQAAFEEAYRSADGRALIRFTPGELNAVVDAAEQALIESGERIYQRGDMLVRVIRRPAMSARNFRRDAGAIGLVALDVPFLVDALTRIAAWHKPDGRSSSTRPCNAPDKVAVTYLSRIGQWKLPRLWAAVDAPTMRPDGTILQEPGYDSETAILYDPGGIEYPRVPDEPTRDQAHEAIEELLETIKTFPFVEHVDRSVALAALIGALVRRSLPAAPLTAITAPVMGSGKTLLGDLISIIATGVSASAMIHPHDEEEASKLLLSVLAEGEAIVLIDNIERELSGGWLCAALTSESYSGRLLGRNATVKVPTCTTWIATGNHLVLAGDLRTRALLCRLDPRCEHPEQRQFEGDLREQLRERRARLVSAGLTVARAFLTSGESESSIVRPWGRFEHWSARVRAPLVWLGLPDPCKSLAQLEREDPERTKLLAMLIAWREAFGRHPATVRDAIDRAMTDPKLREPIENVARDRSGQLDALRLGRWLQRSSGRIVSGLEFERSGMRQGTAIWSVKGEIGEASA